MSFWDNVFASQDQRSVNPSLTSGQSRAWWQDDPGQWVTGTSMSPTVSSGYPGTAPGYSVQDLSDIRRRGHQDISREEAEAIAEFDLATKPKYQAVCDQCGSGNFVVAGTRIGGIVMPTDKCFNCGNSARSPEPAVGGGSGTGSVHTRQIDTGGAGGSMFMRFNGVPRSYAPRA